MEKIAAYIRLSKEDEKKGESESITNQRELIKNYVNKKISENVNFLLMMDIVVAILKDHNLRK